MGPEWSEIKSELIRPALATREDGQKFETLASDPVGNDARCIRHNKLTRTGNPAWATHRRLSLQQIDCFQGSLGDDCGVGF